ncbi:MAG: hypothetical protein ABR889_07815 [Acidobacteriaceae bacterium]|jgi:hypothetical protein
MARPRVVPNSVFLNIPYDNRFQSLYLAYIVGLTELGLTPKATLAIPGGVTRLDRIFDLIQTCNYSVHDLSRVELDRTPPPTPRFNMPLELGLSIAWAKLNPGQHTWFVCESIERRAQKSMSDLNGTDLYIHNGTPTGVMRELSNAFVRTIDRPTVPQMMRSYKALNRLLPTLQINSGSDSVFTARMFTDLITTAADLRDKARLA